MSVQTELSTRAGLSRLAVETLVAHADAVLALPGSDPFLWPPLGGKVKPVVDDAQQRQDLVDIGKQRVEALKYAIALTLLPAAVVCVSSSGWSTSYVLALPQHLRFYSFLLQPIATLCASRPRV